MYSFNVKKIKAIGGVGMAVSNNRELPDKVAFLAGHAKTDPLYLIHDDIGYKHRMINIHAAFGTDHIDRLGSFIETRIRNYNLYKETKESIEGLTLLPFRYDTSSNHWFYSIIADGDKHGIDGDELPKG